MTGGRAPPAGRSTASTMPTGSCRRVADLPANARRVLDDARRAVLATNGSDGRPHVVPVCFAMRGDEIVSAVDHKPKRSERLARLANIERDPSATLLADQWDEDWTRLAWVMVRGEASIRSPRTAERELVARYPQYAEVPPMGPVVCLTPRRIAWWTAS